MIQACWRAFALPVEETLRRYPVSNKSAAAWLRKGDGRSMKRPDLQGASAEINSLSSPKNPTTLFPTKSPGA